MPVYEYRCEDCGETMSVLVMSSSAPAPVCEKCGSARMHKMFSAFCCSSPGGGGAAQSGGGFTGGG